MYKVNGIDLSGAEYRMLKLLRKADKSKTDAKKPSKMSENDMYLILDSLYEKKLIDGVEVGNSKRYDGINENGRSFIRDRRRMSRREWLRAYLPSLIAAIIGVGGTLVGVVLGWWLSLH